MFYLLNIPWNLFKKKKEKEIVNPEVNRVEQKDRVKFLSTCIHSFTDTYGRVYAGALLVNTFGGIGHRQFTCLLWGLFPGLISQVHALSSEAVSHNDTGAWAVKRTDLGLKAIKKENMQPLNVEFFTRDWQKRQ